MDGRHLSSFVPELLSEIFAYCLPEDAADPRLNPEIRGVMRVCRHWHDVAVRTPSFWSNIAISFQSSGLLPDQDAEYARLAQQSIARSHGLGIRIIFNAYDRFIRADHVEETLQVLISHQDQWESLKLLATDTVIERLIGDIAEVPLLQRLVIHPGHGYFDDYCLIALPPCKAPRLQHIGFFKMIPLLTSAEADLQAVSCVDLRHDKLITLRYHLSFLLLCSNLKILNLEIGDKDSSRSSFEGHMSLLLPQLHTLRIRSIPSLHGNHSFRFALDNLHTPSLMNLELEVSSGIEGFVAGQQIIQFLERCSPSLHWLSLRDRCVNIEQALNIFSLIPSLKSFAFEHRFIGSEVFRALYSSRISETALLPNLSYVCLYGRFNESRYDFLNFVTQRSAVRLPGDGDSDEHEDYTSRTLKTINIVQVPNDPYYYTESTESLHWLLQNLDIQERVAQGLQIIVQQASTLSQLSNNADINQLLQADSNVLC